MSALELYHSKVIIMILIFLFCIHPFMFNIFGLIIWIELLRKDGLLSAINAHQCFIPFYKIFYNNMLSETYTYLYCV